jgi:hypothetical protein
VDKSQKVLPGNVGVWDAIGIDTKQERAEITQFTAGQCSFVNQIKEPVMVTQFPTAMNW